MFIPAARLLDGTTRDLWIDGDRLSFTGQDDGTRQFEGCFVIPGLVDAHCHVGMPNAHSTVELIDGFRAIGREDCEQQAMADRDAGTLLIRDLGVPTDTRWIDERTDLPRIVHAHRHISKPKRYMQEVAVEVTTIDELLAAVEEQVREGDGWVKLVGDWIDREVGDIRPVFTAEEAKAAIDRAHELGARVTAHTFGEEAVAMLVAAGIDCIEHGTGITPDVAQQMAANGTALVPTLINIDEFPMYAELGGRRFPRYAEHMLDLFDRRRETLRCAVEAGVDVYVGTDAGGTIEHGRIVDEIEALAALTSPEYALDAVTTKARAWLGFRGIEEGAEADVLVLDKDPREDLSVLRTPLAIILRGQLVGERP